MGREEKEPKKVEENIKEEKDESNRRESRNRPKERMRKSQKIRMRKMPKDERIYCVGTMGPVQALFSFPAIIKQRG